MAPSAGGCVQRPRPERAFADVPAAPPARARVGLVCRSARQALRELRRASAGRRCRRLGWRCVPSASPAAAAAAGAGRGVGSCRLGGLGRGGSAVATACRASIAEGVLVQPDAVAAAGDDRQHRRAAAINPPIAAPAPAPLSLDELRRLIVVGLVLRHRSTSAPAGVASGGSARWRCVAAVVGRLRARPAAGAGAVGAGLPVLHAAGLRAEHLRLRILRARRRRFPVRPADREPAGSAYSASTVAIASSSARFCRSATRGRRRRVDRGELGGDVARAFS